MVKHPPLHQTLVRRVRLGRILLWGYALLVLGFLVLPIVAVAPLAFNEGSFLSYPLAGLSWRWFADFFTSEKWLLSLQNSALVALATTAIATPLGTLAALGLVRTRAHLKPVVTALLIAPLIVPGIITAIAIYFLYAPLRLTNSFPGLILAHVVLATPFVLITVHSTLQNFDVNLLRAGASLGAGPWPLFARVVLPLIAPGVLSGALFAFMTSFDEVIVTLFIAGPAQRTLPLQMFDGVREQISPTVIAAAVMLVLLSMLGLWLVQLLQGHSRKYHRNA